MSDQKQGPSIGEGFDRSDEYGWARYKRERLIRIVDLVTYFTVLLSGVLTLIVPPASVNSTLDHGWVVSWAILLIISGGSGFMGRLTRLWVVEAPGALAGAFGAFVYVIVLVTATIEGQISGFVGATFVACMSLLMVRRYVELQLFTTDPEDKSFTSRLLALTKRRTKDSIASGPN